jgi:hypothetical protein
MKGVVVDRLKENRQTETNEQSEPDRQTQSVLDSRQADRARERIDRPRAYRQGGQVGHGN